MVKANKGPIGGAFVRTFKATGGAITRGYGVTLAATEDDVVVSGAAEASIGVMQETTAQNASGSVVTFGECIAIAGGAISQGDWVKTDAAGKFVASAGEDTANVGRAMSDGVGDGDEFVLFVNPVKKRA